LITQVGHEDEQLTTVVFLEPVRFKFSRYKLLAPEKKKRPPTVFASIVKVLFSALQTFIVLPADESVTRVSVVANVMLSVKMIFFGTPEAALDISALKAAQVDTSADASQSGSV